MLTKRIILGLSLLCAGICVLPAQHSAVFSQYMFNQMVVNPAYTGSRNALSFSGASRFQWVGFKGAPTTFTFSAHAPLKDTKSNLGVTAFNDQLGVTQTTGLYGFYAFRMQLGAKARLALGLQGGLNMRKTRFSQAERNDWTEVDVDGDSPTIIEPRAGFGIYFDSERFYAGFSTPQLLRYRTASWDQYNGSGINYNSYFLTAGTVVGLNPDLKLKPSFLVKYIKGSPVSADLNMNLIYLDKFWLGASYRHKDAVVGMVEFQVNEQLRLGYAYDYLLNPLSSYSTGSHELFIRYELNWHLEGLHPRYF